MKEMEVGVKDVKWRLEGAWTTGSAMKKNVKLDHSPVRFIRLFGKSVHLLWLHLSNFLIYFFPSLSLFVYIACINSILYIHHVLYVIIEIKHQQLHLNQRF